MSKKGRIPPIKEVIDGVLDGWQKDKLSKKEILEAAWKKACGKKALRHTRIASFKSERLIVEVNGSAWIYQLTLKKPEILKKLKKELSEFEVEDIQFRIGDFK
jgi:predicted nucleic acid-binding Zn ribbon protein